MYCHAYQAVHRSTFRQAYQLIAPQPALLGPWQQLLDRAATGADVAAADVAWAQKMEQAGWQRRSTPHGWRDYAAGRTFNALYRTNHGGDSRGLVQLFALTAPDESAANRWLQGVGEAIAAAVTEQQIEPVAATG
ncbi:hypothetical protein [Krasilnikovia sp. M28-CT-15]|uniref:hypothetical protein n=1 Tax=Krasilnikovia sp. M28-CT-15 TaxID=3373540 RepID=UPI0038760353